MSFIALLGPIVGLALGFDAVNSERSNGTLNRLVSQPIYRDAIIGICVVVWGVLFGLLRYVV